MFAFSVNEADPDKNLKELPDHPTYINRKKIHEYFETFEELPEEYRPTLLHVPFMSTPEYNMASFGSATVFSSSHVI